MKDVNKLIAWLCMATLPMTAVSCHDDDDDEPVAEPVVEPTPEPPAPSRAIVRFDAELLKNDTAALVARFHFTYDKEGRISHIRTEYRDQEVSYNYSAEKLSYRWDGVDEEAGTFIIRFEGDIYEGHINILTSEMGENNKVNYNYYYTQSGYIREVSYGASQKLSYAWSADDLQIKDSHSLYDASYTFSQTANDYSIDLNMLPLLVDSRKDLPLVMNVYGQLSGLLGTKYPYFMQDTDYSYHFYYDDDQRLAIIHQEADNRLTGKQDSYRFTLTYED